MMADMWGTLTRLMMILPPAPPRLFVHFSPCGRPGRSPIIPGLHGRGTETAVVHPDDRKALEHLICDVGLMLKAVPGDVSRYEVVPLRKEP